MRCIEIDYQQQLSTIQTLVQNLRVANILLSRPKSNNNTALIDQYANNSVSLLRKIDRDANDVNLINTLDGLLSLL